MGRPPMKQPETFDAVYALWKDGMLSARSAARMLGVSHHTFSKWVHAAAG